MNKKYADFSQLEDLAERIGMTIALDDRASKFKREEILKAGSYELMKQLLKDTPMGRNGSNWYYWQHRVSPPSAAYTLYGKDSRAGTLRMGWVKESWEHPERGGKPTFSDGKLKVDTTRIDKSGNELSMTFHNSAPYAKAVEYGHWVRYPWFYHKETLNHNRVKGKYYTQRAIWHSEEAIKKAVKKQMVTMLKQVVKNK